MRRSRRKYWIAGLVVLLVTIGVTTYLLARPQGPRSDVILFKVKKEPLNVSVTEKGTLESAANTDLICKVRAGSKNFATSINWVVDDGTRVNPGDLLMLLDDSALKDLQESQEITVAQRLGDKLIAEREYEIQLKANEINIAQAVTDLLNAQIALEKLLGIEVDPNLIPLAAIAGIPSSLTENGSYRQSLDDLTGKITNALSDVEQNRERSAWSERMVKQAYMSPAQAEADKSRLESSLETLRSQRAAKALLMNYDRPLQITDVTSKRDNARLSLDKARLTADNLAAQKLTDLKTKSLIYTKEYDKLVDIKQQRGECRISAPTTIRPGSMVVYFKPDGNRFGNSTQALIEQGAQVKEGQKMLRIPNLEAMQVNTKIHEAMVSRIRGDNRTPTRILDLFQLGLFTNLDPFGRGFATRQAMQEQLANCKVRDSEAPVSFKLTDHVFHVLKRADLPDTVLAKLDSLRNKEFSQEEFGEELTALLSADELKKYQSTISTHAEMAKRTPLHDLEFHLNEIGQRTIVRIDAMPDKRYLAHVKSVSQVASQNDVFISDVKLYPTLVTVDNEIGPDGQLMPVSGEILKPDMTAEVTINVDASKEPVLTIPLQTIIGGAEMGATREVFVKTPTGYERRAIKLGLYNDKMIEVREGLTEGDEVVTNPKVLIGDAKTKTRDGGDQKSGGKGDGKEGGGGDPSKKGKKGGGGPPGGGPGGPKA